ncbi:hypothetical protein ACFL27_27600 [candidate division CSSED10-310 bacterium]|uniref:Single-stranded DNA-binding protein n=1 Tax=candidate division CSSED10-310 bacterium TaxID=2855610 RepID=A0ABV6Z6A2_UNCC1
MNIKDEMRVNVYGIIIPFSWNNKGDVTGICINTFDEEEFVISKYGKGKTLLKHLSQLVEVWGRVKKSKDGKKNIVISSFKIKGMSDEKGS